MGKSNFFVALILILIGGSGYMLWLGTHPEEKYVEIDGKKGKQFYEMPSEEDTTAAKDVKKDEKEQMVKFDLVDPENAPEDKLYMIMYGFYIMQDTASHCKDNVGNTISCNNCHFNAGNTLGGKNRGISLVGVTEMYPRFSKRDNKNITLSDRLDNCYKRSLNGKPLPENCIERAAILEYLKWISQEVKDAPKYPWLGLKPLTSKHEPDIKNGERLYKLNCSICHGDNGEGSAVQGTEGVPPLWGDNSFNDGAGMCKLEMAASFIYYNMPFGQPILTEDEAIDIAGYVVKQPRPKFQN